MPRKYESTERFLKPDPKYGNRVISKFINCLMVDGKKATARQVVYGALDIIRERTKDDPLKIFKKAVENIKPVLEVKSRRVGGSTYQVPIEVRPARRLSLALRWLISFGDTGKGNTHNAIF